jgi:cellulose synthase/poly-beta-1,6-N-acetylglucosamine synthase-like glycosyltransferase
VVRHLWEWLLWGTLGVTAYAYVGYGLLIWLIGRWVDHPSWRSDDLPTISIVIAAYNEVDVIADRLRNCLALDYPPDRLEVLVVADGCTDGTEAVVAACPDPRVRLLLRPRRAGKVNALNAAVAVAHGEIVVGSDANCFFRSDALHRLVRHFGDPRVAMVAGEKRIQAGPGVASLGEGLYWRYESWLKRLDSRVSSVLGATGEIFAVRRSRYFPLPEDSIIEDFVLSMGLVMQGFRVVYEPEAIATETASASMADEFKRKVRIVAGGWQSVVRLWPLLLPTRGVLTFQYLSHRVLRWIVVPIALPLAFLASLLLAVQGRDRWLALGGLALLALAASGWWLERRGYRWKPAYLAYYFLFQNVAALCGAWRYFRRAQPVTWEKARRLEVP